ncbi:MAG: metallophosphatase family protein [Chloroflexi bacterium]|nr:metallophosphatase family protein [Chloroflexota bacterium]MCL5275935.1 metallophosphatase family protein [Chloroflexota bacterium]
MGNHRLGILADTHNNATNLSAALDIFRANEIDQLIHCGDVTSPLMLEHLSGFEVWLVRGNNDYDWSGFRSEARRLGNIHYCGKDAGLEFARHRVAVCHGDDESLVSVLVQSGLYEWVFRGHSHRHEVEITGHTRLLNPGALGGRHPHGEERSVAVVDLDEARSHFITLDGVKHPGPRV